MITKIKNKHSVVAWGTYDLGKPRVRLLLKGLRSQNIEVIECHHNVWSGVEDKSQLKGFGRIAARAFSWLLAYPLLIWRYLRLPSHSIVLVPYMGQLDVLMLWPFARIRRAKIVWDVFICLYDTLVEDRRLISKRSLPAIIVYYCEWLSCRLADLLLMDTKSHALYLESLFNLPANSVKSIFVGAEDIFNKSSHNNTETLNNQSLRVLFYGQFIPLHGIGVIVEAAQKVEKAGKSVIWEIIGKGQEEKAIEELIHEFGVKSIRRIPWIPYDRLPEKISRADICLGIFGQSVKASNVIPNKVFQILAMGKPLITADTPAMREIYTEKSDIYLVPPGDSHALAETVLNFLIKPDENNNNELKGEKEFYWGAEQVGKKFVELLREINDDFQA